MDGRMARWLGGGMYEWIGGWWVGGWMPWFDILLGAATRDQYTHPLHVGFTWERSAAELVSKIAFCCIALLTMMSQYDLHVVVNDLAMFAR